MLQPLEGILVRWGEELNTNATSPLCFQKALTDKSSYSGDASRVNYSYANNSKNFQMWIICIMQTRLKASQFWNWDDCFDVSNRNSADLRQLLLCIMVSNQCATFINSTMIMVFDTKSDGQEGNNMGWCVVTNLQTCTLLVMFANIMYNFCKYLHHYANVHMYLVDCCGGLKEEWMFATWDWWAVRGGMRQSNFFTNVLCDLCKHQKWLLHLQTCNDMLADVEDLYMSGNILAWKFIGMRWWKNPQSSQWQSMMNQLLCVYMGLYCSHSLHRCISFNF